MTYGGNRPSMMAGWGTGPGSPLIAIRPEQLEAPVPLPPIESVVLAARQGELPVDRR